MSNKRGLEAGELHPPHKKQFSNHDVFYANTGNSSESSDFSSIHDGNDGNGGNYDELSSLLQNLEMAPVLGNTSDDMENGSSGHRQIQNGSTSAVIEKEEIGDELQQKAISLAMDGENLFLTGKAGTGKSWTTKRIVKGFQSKNEIIHVTAPTGIAAINVDGQTIHSWGRFGLGEYYENFDSMMSPDTRKKIKSMNALLIDEISMLDGHLFDVLECAVAIIRCYDEELGRRLKRLKEESGSKNTVSPHTLKVRWDNECGLGDLPPWGDLQLIVVGDFYQLPPVPNKFEVLMASDGLTERDYDLKIGRQGCYAFESHAWRRSEFHTVELEEVHRQDGNDGLFELLNAMREGESDLAAKHGEALSAMQSPLRPRSDGIVATELHSTNNNVDQRNKEELDKLSWDFHCFEALDEVVFSGEYKHKLLKKYGLEEISSMPYLFSFVETPPTPPHLVSARMELDKIQKEIDNLDDDDDAYEELFLKNRKKRLHQKKKIAELEEEHEKKTTITSSTIQSFIEKYELDSNANELFKQFLVLQNKVKSDFHELDKFAQEMFFERGCRVGHHVEMKKDAQVMLLYNLNVKEKLANGSRGKVIGFMPTMGYLCLLKQEEKRRSKGCKSGSQDENKELGPLCTPESDDLRSLGASDTESSIGKQNDSGEGNEEDKVEDFDFSSVDQEVLEITKSDIERMDMDSLDRELRDMERIIDSKIQILPFVQFLCGTKRLIRPRSFAKEFKGCGKATRWQIPLTLAWAISIHKSQGMTIDLLHADVEKCFAEGQAYVACSRGKSLDSIYVENFKPHVVKTSKKVKKFYSSLKPGGEPYTGTWSDTIDAFDREITGRIDTRKRLEEEYKDTPCQKCGRTLVIKQVHTDTNHNRGKWYVRCPAVYSDGHTFIFLNGNPKQQCRANHTPKADSFANLKPGAGGAIAGVLQGMRFVLTGTFPEIGGGVGLDIGKEKLKEIVRSFGGNVTGSISGKTDFLLIGEEPGEKKIQEAKAREITSMNLSQLRQILLGKADLP